MIAAKIMYMYSKNYGLNLSKKIVKKFYNIQKKNNAQKCKIKKNNPIGSKYIQS